MGTWFLVGSLGAMELNCGWRQGDGACMMQVLAYLSSSFGWPLKRRLQATRLEKILRAGLNTTSSPQLLSRFFVKHAESAVDLPEGQRGYLRRVRSHHPTNGSRFNTEIPTQLLSKFIIKHVERAVDPPGG